MGYWPNKMKRRRHNWVTNLGRKLVLLGCTGHHNLTWTSRVGGRRKMYVLNRPGYDGESAWAAGGHHIGRTQVQGFSEDNTTVKGAKMMELID